MLFNSYEFIFLFLPIVLLGYYVFLPQRARLPFLTILSYVFYGWWDYRFVSLMFLTTVIDYIAGLGIDRAKTQGGRKGWLLVSVISGLSLLGFFKYYELMARTTNEIATWFHGAPVQALPLLHLILPIGISFYTFHSMSYTIDIYRGVVKPAERFWNFSCFVALFTQLVAGPIIRYRDMAEQLVSRTHTLDKVHKGIVFFVLGLVKKVILADGVAPLVGTVFDLQSPGLIASWVGVLSYAMQIYFDFSGYSDMAVGLGYLFGFQIPQNFNSPYKALSITDFWRRWHISLSTWLRDYLYVSLGGNRKGALRTYVNLFLTMLLGGLWHGANWTFVVWGGYHGLLLAIERATGKKSLMGWAPAAVQRGFAFLLVLIGWVLFRCDTLGHAGALLSGMAGFNGVGAQFIGHLKSVPLSCAMLAVTLGMVWALPNTWEIRWRPGFWSAVALGTMFVACVLKLSHVSEFLYYQF